MKQDIHYKKVPAPEIESAGIADLMRIPADGVNRNKHINWQGARFAVRASFLLDGRPMHEIIVDYPSEKSSTGYYSNSGSIDLDEKGLPEAVATTSGSHREGMGHFSDEQKRIVSELIQRSIDAGEEESQ